MDYTKLDLLSYNTLKVLCQEMELPIGKSKSSLINMVTEAFQEYEEYKTNKIDKYTIKEQLGNKGKEGTTYLVTTHDGTIFAMKTFRRTKSSSKLKDEVRMQHLASKHDISPFIVDKDVVSKYIVMEKMDTHLVDIIEKQNGILTPSQQKRIINIYKTLDNIGIFHADANLMNYMIKNRKIYIIDFGMAKLIDEKLIKKLGTSTPNLHIMTLGLILKLKECKCPSKSYEHLKKYLPTEQKTQFQI